MTDLLRAGPLRVRSLGPEGGPVILLCHGFGAPGDDLVPLASATDAGRGTRWLFPEAPLEADIGFPGARAWWPVDMLRLQLELSRGGRMWDEAATPEGMLEARGQLIEALRALIRDHGVDPGRAILGGFSQGAMIATDVVLTAELGFRNLVILSGSRVRSDAWAEGLARVGLARELHVLQSHGLYDPILPFGVAEALHRTLTEAGASTSFIQFHGAHEIRPVVLDALGRFAHARLHASDVRP